MNSTFYPFFLFCVFRFLLKSHLNHLLRLGTGFLKLALEVQTESNLPFDVSAHVTVGSRWTSIRIKDDVGHVP